MQDKNKLSYLAGMIDGEGSICITTCLRWHWTNAAKTSRKQYQTFQLFISITNTSEALMKWLVQNFGGVYCPKKRYNSIKHAEAWDWQVRGKANKKRILLSILPYLIVKKEQAKIGLKYLELGDWCKEEREELRQRMVPLNLCGPSETNTLNIPIEHDGIKIESELCSDVQSELSVS